MKRDWWYRFIFMVIVLVITGAMITPTVFNLKDDSKFPVKSKINLGLDLQGGLYIVLGIDFNKVYRDEVATYARKVVEDLKQQGIESEIGKLNIDNPTDPSHEIILSNAVQLEKAKDRIKDFFGYPLRLTNENGATLSYGMGREFKEEIESTAVTKSIEVIRNRIDEFGVTEPEINSLGTDRIVVQLPGVKDIERAKELIGKTAKLEFKFVNDEVAPAKLGEWLDKAEKAGVTFKKGESFSNYILRLNQLLADDLPKGYQIVFQKIMSKTENEMTDKIPFLVQAVAPLSGDDLQDARVSINQQENTPFVSLSFKPQGAKIFEQLTSENVGKRMAIILDGNVYSDPVIRERIGGGVASITMGAGNYNDQFAQSRDLALVLRAGALPVELEFQEQRIVGPSLGVDSINSARLASIIGSMLVFVFLIVWYKTSGAIAVFTLVFNVIIILASLIGLEATLTLPGIAGIALTIGMAVDANIIIYERIREELAVGAAKLQAIEAGFGKAFWTVLDANLTTAAAGIALLNFGTGPIRGFAVTLLIGIAATVYCSYFVGNLIFEYYLEKSSSKKISI
jgi:protein-export membrane protein SecD